jgi:hypothetical protein
LQNLIKSMPDQIMSVIGVKRDFPLKYIV